MGFNDEQYERPGGILDDSKETLRRARELLDKVEQKQLIDRADRLLNRVETFWLFKLLGL